MPKCFLGFTEDNWIRRIIHPMLDCRRVYLQMANLGEHCQSTGNLWTMLGKRRRYWELKPPVREIAIFHGHIKHSHLPPKEAIGSLKAAPGLPWILLCSWYFWPISPPFFGGLAWPPRIWQDPIWRHCLAKEATRRGEFSKVAGGTREQTLCWFPSHNWHNDLWIRSFFIVGTKSFFDCPAWIAWMTQSPERKGVADHNGDKHEKLGYLKILFPL